MFGRQIPDVVDGFALGCLLGSGSCSEVHFAMEVETGINCCVKVIDKSKIGSDADVMHQRREIEVLSRLEHPNIVKFVKYVEDEEFVYIFQELCQGQNLLELINECNLSENVCAHIFRQICSALNYAHERSVWHRDIKPENILVDDDYNVKVIDFGFCGVADSCNTLLDTFCGSLFYAAPEVLDGKPYVGWQADVWSLGVVLYAMLVGRLPWDCQNVPHGLEQIRNATYEIDDCITPLVQDLISKMIAKNGDMRLTVAQILRHPWLTFASTLTQTHSHFPVFVQLKEMPKEEKVGSGGNRKKSPDWGGHCHTFSVHNNILKGSIGGSVPTVGRRRVNSNRRLSTEKQHQSCGSYRHIMSTFLGHLPEEAEGILINDF